MKSAFTVVAFLGLILCAFSFILPSRRLSALSLNALGDPLEWPVWPRDYPLADDVTRCDNDRAAQHEDYKARSEMYGDHISQLKELLDPLDLSASYVAVATNPSSSNFTSTVTVPPIPGVFAGATVQGHTLKGKTRARKSAALEFLRLYWTTLKAASDEFRLKSPVRVDEPEACELSAVAFEWPRDYALAEDVVAYDRERSEILIRSLGSLSFATSSDQRKIIRDHKSQLKQLLDSLGVSASYVTDDSDGNDEFTADFKSTLTVPPIPGVFAGATVQGHILNSKTRADRSAALEFLRVHWTTLKAASVAIVGDFDQESYY